MNQTGSNSRQKIEIEVNFPPKLIFHENAEDPEKERITEEVPEICMKKHGCNDLPGILVSRGGIEMLPDPELSTHITPEKNEINEPIYQEDGDGHPRKILSRKVCSDRNHR
jgi:hypothetical protein